MASIALRYAISQNFDSKKKKVEIFVTYPFPCTILKLKSYSHYTTLVNFKTFQCKYDSI